MEGIIEGLVLAFLKYFCPTIYRALHQDSTIQAAATDPKLAKKYASAYEEWKAKKDKQ